MLSNRHCMLLTSRCMQAATPEEMSEEEVARYVRLDIDPASITWKVYGPDSIEHFAAIRGLSLRKICFACDLYTSSVSWLSDMCSIDATSSMPSVTRAMNVSSGMGAGARARRGRSGRREPSRATIAAPPMRAAIETPAFADVQAKDGAFAIESFWSLLCCGAVNFSVNFRGEAKLAV